MIYGKVTQPRKVIAKQTKQSQKENIYGCTRRGATKIASAGNRVEKQSQNIKIQIPDLNASESTLSSDRSATDELHVGAVTLNRDIAVREAFDFLDFNGEGQITKDKLGNFMRQQLKTNPSESELQDLINEVDAKSDGAIDFDEFKDLMMIRQKTNDDIEELMEAFKVFDTDNDGIISTARLGQIINELQGNDLTFSEVQEIIRLADPTNTGRITQSQFINVMRANNM